MLSRIKYYLLAASLFSALVAVPLPALSEVKSAAALLARMAKASRTLNYSGTFTYEDGAGSVESLTVSHTVDQGIEIERIAHLNGPPLCIYLA